MRAIDAWKRCEDAQNWPQAIDSIMVVDWEGEQIGWPQFRGESFTIFRLSDASVVEEEALPSEVACALDWKVAELRPPVALQTSPAAP